MGFLSKLLDILNKDLTGKTWTEKAEHPFFGPVVLYARKEAYGSYWEAAIQFEGRTLGVGIESPDRTLPSDAQVEFANRILSDVDEVFRRASELLVKNYEEWHKHPFPEDWREAFVFVGFSVPLGADETNDWYVSFDDFTDTHKHMFTCYFEGGKPTHVSIDG